MGYNVSYEGYVSIPRAKEQEILAAINELHTDENLIKNANGGSYQAEPDLRPIREKRWYSYIRNPEEGGFKTLEEAFSTWRIFAEFNDTGSNEERIVYSGNYDEYLGQQDIFLRTIAPFCDFRIEARGSDGALWLWESKNGVFLDINGHVVYDEFSDQ